jgi:hypothetical protein
MSTPVNRGQPAIPAHASDQSSQVRTSLFIRPRVINGESWIGYLLRLSEGNHFPSIAAIAGVCGYANFSDLFRRDPRVVLCKIGAPVVDALDWAPHRERRPLRPKMAQSAPSVKQWQTRLCPLCLTADAERPYLRSHWDWPMQIHCPHHQVMLLELCRSCHRPISMRRKQVVHCSCGADFRRQRPPESGGATGALARLLPELDLDRVGKTFEREPPIDAQALRVCQWLALPAQANGKRANRKGQKKVWPLSDDLTSLCELVKHWPVALVNSVAPEVDLNSLLSRTALGIRLVRNHFGLFDLVTDEIQKISQSSISYDEPWPTVHLPYSLTSYRHVDALARLTGHARSFLRSQIQACNMSSSILKPDDLFDEDRVDIDAHTLSCATTFYAETLDLKVAAMKAGCSSQAMTGLVKSSLIPTVSLFRDQTILRVRRIQPDVLQDFARELFSLAQLDQRVSVDRISFSSWVTSHARGPVNRHLRWRDLLTAIRSGKLTLFTDTEYPGKLDQLFLRAEDAVSVCDKRRNSHQCFL